MLNPVTPTNFSPTFPLGCPTFLLLTKTCSFFLNPFNLLFINFFFEPNPNAPLFKKPNNCFPFQRLGPPLFISIYLATFFPSLFDRTLFINHSFPFVTQTPLQTQSCSFSSTCDPYKLFLAYCFFCSRVFWSRVPLGMSPDQSPPFFDTLPLTFPVSLLETTLRHRAPRQLANPPLFPPTLAVF